MIPIKDTQLSVEDATKYIIQALRQPKTAFDDYGYDVDMYKIMASYAHQHLGADHNSLHTCLWELSPLFFDAASILVQRGLFRVSKSRWCQNHMIQHAGNGYSLTQQGREWLFSNKDEVFIHSDPSSMGQFLATYRTLLGDGFCQRAQEAVKCINSGAHLACCVMAGAATESIFIKIAIAKFNDEKGVLDMYRSAGGTRRLKNSVSGNLPEQLKVSFNDLMGLLESWRNEAAHGVVSEISNLEAQLALYKLMRLAEFTKNNWETLIVPAKLKN